MIGQIYKSLFLVMFWAVISHSYAQNIAMHKYDFVPDLEDSVVTQRLQDIQSEICLDFNSYVKSQIYFYSVKKRNYMRKMLARKAKYFPIFEKYLAAHDMPDQIKYLSVVESALNPIVKSHAGAVGLWQFMPATGRAMGLKQDYYLDERRDIEKSTEAACKYLSSLYETYHDWQLALAAYNCGPGNINKAKKRSGKDTFWGIYNYLPRETRAYVPIFTAIVYTMSYADELNLFPDTSYHTPRVAQIEVNNYFNFEQFAKTTNLCLDQLLSLNTVVKYNVIPDYVPSYTLNLPEDKLALLSEKPSILLDAKNTRREKDKKVISKTPSVIYHKIRSGESLSTIARKYHVYTSDLKRWNGIRGTTIYAGKKLKIYKKPNS